MSESKAEKKIHHCPKCSKMFSKRQNLERKCNHTPVFWLDENLRRKMSENLTIAVRKSWTIDFSLVHQPKGENMFFFGLDQLQFNVVIVSFNNNSEEPLIEGKSKADTQVMNGIHVVAGHLVVHDEAKAYSCAKCDSTFTEESEYRQHARVHEERKPFSCSHCSSSFNVESNYLLHLQVHVEDRHKQFRLGNVDQKS